MGGQSPKPAALAIVIAFALSAFILGVVIWKAFYGSVPLEAEGYRVSVRFGAEATNLVTNSEVRISGIRVGRVTKTEVHQDSVRATLELEREFAPLHRDARAIVRAKTLLGENFIELAPGRADAPRIPDGGTIPTRNVTTAQTVDQVLGVFDERTRRSLTRFIGALDQGLDGRSTDLSATLATLEPTAGDLDRVLEVLDRQRPAVRQLVRDSGRSLTAISARQDALRELVAAGAGTLRATARRDRDLTATVEALPPFLRSLRRTLSGADSVVREATPLVRALRPAAPAVRPALRGALELAPPVERLLRDARPAIPELRRALPGATRMLDAARPLLAELDDGARDLVPPIQLASAYRRDITSSFANVGAASNATEGVRAPGGDLLRYARAALVITTEMLYGQSQRLPTSRRNAYRAPGALDEAGRDGLRAFECSNVNNTATLPVIGSAPPCVEQGPWRFNGVERRFPRLERYRPGR